MKGSRRKILVSLLLALIPLILFAQNKKVAKIPEGMVLIPAGEFWMGSDEKDCKSGGCGDDEGPKHKVYLDAYYIDRYEVTNTQYKDCTNAGKCEKPNDITFYDNPQYANHPVVYIDWYQANTFCKWKRKRLPSEAEWEKAARGKGGNIWPIGNTWDESKCNNRHYKGDLASQMANMASGRGTAPVGSFFDCVSFYGVYDMAGNVWEWVSDWYDESYYRGAGVNGDPKGPTDGQYKVRRGGSWLLHIPDYFRGAYRDWVEPFYWVDVIGFRCAEDAD